jgi:hypothetical protein
MSAVTNDSPPASGAAHRRRSPVPLWKRLIPLVHPFVAAAVVLAAGLAVAWRVWYPYDVQVCFLPWGEASGGWRFWDIYRLKSDCNYPPFILYLLTLTDALRRLTHAGLLSTPAVVLSKLPFLVAHAAGALACYYGLRRPFGGRTARRTALLYALCTALFVNAAHWGQADALVSLAMVAAALLLVNDRPVWAGAAFGWALSIKLQGIVIAPVLLAYCLRRFGVARTALGALAGVGVLALVALPFVLTGNGKGVLAAYTGAAGYYPFRSLNAMNLWGAWNEVEKLYRPWLTEGDRLNADTRAAFGNLSAHHFGLVLLGAWNALLVWRVWRRPDRDRFLLACGVSGFAFFVLPTQMHERYGVPGVALLALPALTAAPRLALFLCASAVATWNQWLVLMSNYLPSVHRSTAFWDTLWGRTFFPCALLNCALLLFGTFLMFSGGAPADRRRGHRED